MKNWVVGEQPHRVVPERRRLRGWPHEDGDPHAGELEKRVWPVGRHDGGFMFGNGDACRAADVLIEDHAGPPLHCAYFWDRLDAGEAAMVESTHVETKITHRRADGVVCAIHTIPHPDGIR